MTTTLKRTMQAATVCLILIFGFNSNVDAANYTWNGSYGHWEAPHNWIPHGVPSVNDKAIINSGAARIQNGISVSVGNVIIGTGGELRIYANNTLNVVINSNARGIENNGSLKIYGTLNIESTGTGNGYAIDNDGDINVTSTGECNISNISNHGILNYGSINNWGEIDIEISPNSYKWGIINFLKLYNYQNINLNGINGSNDNGGILNLSAGDLQNHHNLIIREIHGTGIKNYGPILNKGYIELNDCGKYGLRQIHGSQFTNEGLASRLEIKNAGITGLLTNGTVVNSGYLIVTNAANAALHIEVNGSLSNSFALQLIHSPDEMLVKGSLVNNELGYITTKFGITTYSGSSVVNHGRWHAHFFDRGNIYQDIINKKILHNYWGENMSGVKNLGIIIGPYDNDVFAGVPANDFIDIYSSVGLTYDSNVYNDQYLSQVIGSYNSQNNTFTPNANAIGLTSVYLRIKINAVGYYQRYEVFLDSPINFQSEGPDLSQRSSDSSTSAFSIYPVPANQILNLEHDFSESFDFAIINANGQVLREGNMTGTKIDIQDIPEGHYALRVRSGGQVKIKKFIKI